MLRLGAFLLSVLIVSIAGAPAPTPISTTEEPISTTTAMDPKDYRYVMMDPSGCVNLLCQWQGVGKHCGKFKRNPIYNSTPFEFLNVNDSAAEAHFLAKIERQYPLNTFTVVKNNVSGEKCKRKVLMCNSFMTLTTDKEYKVFFDILKSQKSWVKPKLVCDDTDTYFSNPFVSGR